MLTCSNRFKKYTFTCWQFPPLHILSWTSTFKSYIERKAYSPTHYDDVIMTMLESQITSLTVVYSIVYTGVHQRKHQSSASLAFVREIHRGPVNFPHKWPVTRKMFPFDDVIMHSATLIFGMSLSHEMPSLSSQSQLKETIWLSYWKDISSFISIEIGTKSGLRSMWWYQKCFDHFVGLYAALLEGHVLYIIMPNFNSVPPLVAKILAFGFDAYHEFFARVGANKVNVSGLIF